MIAVILFICCMCYFCINFFTNRLNEKIKNLSRQSKEIETELQFINGQVPRERFKLKETELEHENLEKKIADLKSKLSGSTEGEGFNPPEKALMIIKNAKELLLEIQPGGVSDKQGQKIYTLALYCKFADLYKFLTKCYQIPGGISFKMLMIESHGENVHAEVEFIL